MDGNEQNSPKKSSINLDAVIEYEREMRNGDVDCIEFGSAVSASDIVSYDKSSDNGIIPSEETAQTDEKTNQTDVTNDHANVPPMTAPKDTTPVKGKRVIHRSGEITNTRLKARRPGPLYLIFLIALIVLVVLVCYFVSKSSTEQPPTPAPVASTPEHTESESAPTTVSLTISTEYESYFIVNGIAQNANTPQKQSKLSLISDAINQVSAYVPNHIPQNFLTDSRKQLSQTELPSSESSAKYWQSSLIIKAPSGMEIPNTQILINGKPVPSSGEIKYQAVSGFPCFIQIHQEGKLDHLEVIWPTKSTEIIEIPELRDDTGKQNFANYSLNVPAIFQNEAKIAINSKTVHGDHNGSYEIPSKELVHTKITHEGKQAIDLVIDTSPFGSIRVTPYMKAAQGDSATLHFDSKMPKNIELCFKRTAETHCIATDVDAKIPTGQWEIQAYSKEANETPLLNAPLTEHLYPGTTYVISGKSRRKGLELNIAAEEAPKEKRGKHKIKE